MKSTNTEFIGSVISAKRTTSGQWRTYVIISSGDTCMMRVRRRLTHSLKLVGVL
jgi:hypothetical protein